MRFPDSNPVKLIVSNEPNTATENFIASTATDVFFVDTDFDVDVRRCWRESQATLQLAQTAIPKHLAQSVYNSVAAIHSFATVLASPRTFADDGLLDDAECALVLGDLYLMAYLLDQSGIAIESFGASNTNKVSSAIVSYAREHGAVKEIVIDGHSLLRTTSPEAWTSTMETLRDETLDIIAHNDRLRAAKLLATHNAATEQRWTRNTLNRMNTLGLPTTIVWQPPVLRAIRNDAGSIVDVTLDEDATWIDANLAWAGRIPDR